VVAEADKGLLAPGGDHVQYRWPGATTSANRARPVRRAAAWPAPRLHEQPDSRVGKELERKYLVDVAACKLRDDGVHDK